MTNLLPEILHLIFSLLVQKDRLECMAVCRQWHDIITRDSLFCKIYLDKFKQLEHLMERVETEPDQGRKVKSLTLQLRLPRNYNTKILIDLFPNLRAIAILNTNESSNNNIPITPYENHPWCNRIEMIQEKESDYNTRTLLFSGLCDNLSYISVSGGGGVWEPINSFLEALGNAPALKKLYLKNYPLSFQDLELLHDTVPLLDTLSLNNVLLQQTPVPVDIRPAVLLKTFRCKIYCADSTDDSNPQLPYIVRKYTHLEELELYLRVYDHENQNPEWDGNGGATILPVNAREVFASYLMIVGPRLKILKLGLPGFDIKSLDECGCQINELDLFIDINIPILPALIKTNQLQYIRTLTLYQLCDDYTSSHSLRQLQCLKMLKQLSLKIFEIKPKSSKRKVDIFDILGSSGESQLENISVHNVKLNCDHSRNSNTYPSLKQLVVRESTFSNGTANFISRVCPNLKRMKLIDCFNKEDSLIMPHADLLYLEIVNTIKHKSFPILVITLGNGEQRLYQCTRKRWSFVYYNKDEKNDLFPLPSISSCPYDKSADIPMLTVAFNSVYDFSMKTTGPCP